MPTARARAEQLLGLLLGSRRDLEDAIVYALERGFTVEHLSRGLIPDDLATFDWASRYASPFCASLTEEEAYVSARLACLEMISNGTGPGDSRTARCGPMPMSRRSRRVTRI